MTECHTKKPQAKNDSKWPKHSKLINNSKMVQICQKLAENLQSDSENAKIQKKPKMKKKVKLTPETKKNATKNLNATFQADFNI